jgi:hypothetical protein
MPQNDPLSLPPFHFDADPGPTFHSDADPYPASQKDAISDLQLCFSAISDRKLVGTVPVLPNY